MVKNTRKQRRKGGMVRALAKPAKDFTLSVGSEVFKSHLQKKGPGIIKTIYDDPTSAKDPNIYLYGRKSPSTLPQKIKPVESYMNAPNIFDENNENLNPNIIKPKPIKITPIIGGKTKKRKLKKRKSIKNRK